MAVRTLKKLATVADVIRKLGGARPVHLLVGEPYPPKTFHQTIWNWKERGRMPAEHFDAMRRELERLGYWASPALWKQTPRFERTASP